MITRTFSLCKVDVFIGYRVIQTFFIYTFLHARATQSSKSCAQHFSAAHHIRGGPRPAFFVLATAERLSAGRRPSRPCRSPARSAEALDRNAHAPRSTQTGSCVLVEHTLRFGSVPGLETDPSNVALLCHTRSKLGCFSCRDRCRATVVDSPTPSDVPQGLLSANSDGATTCSRSAEPLGAIPVCATSSKSSRSDQGEYHATIAKCLTLLEAPHVSPSCCCVGATTRSLLVFCDTRSNMCETYCSDPDDCHATVVKFPIPTGAPHVSLPHTVAPFLIPRDRKRAFQTKMSVTPQS